MKKLIIALVLFGIPGIVSRAYAGSGGPSSRARARATVMRAYYEILSSINPNILEPSRAADSQRISAPVDETQKRSHCTASLYESMRKCISNSSDAAAADKGTRPYALRLTGRHSSRASKDKKNNFNPTSRVVRRTPIAQDQQNQVENQLASSGMPTSNQAEAGTFLRSTVMSNVVSVILNDGSQRLARRGDDGVLRYLSGDKAVVPADAQIAYRRPR